jgi:extracellular elastinolytic metalloproteinase
VSWALHATQPAEYLADPDVQETSSGARAVHLQQQYKGLSIFEAAETVRFSPDGQLQEAVGNSITVEQDLPIMPQLTVQEAVTRAAEHVAIPGEDEQGETDQFGEPLIMNPVDLTGFEPQVIATFSNQIDRSTVLEPGPFGDKIKASLLWFPLNDSLRLVWEVILVLPAQTGQFRTLVDAGTGEILYCQQLMEFVAARGNVYRIDGSSSRQMTDFPRLLTDYNLPIPANLPNGFPDTWVEQDSAIGNSVNAHLGTSPQTTRGTPQNGVLTFNPSDPEGDDQKVLNIFYYNCYMHDFFYLLGFQEADGNFQQNNFGRGAAASDRVDARAHSGAVQGTANMWTPADGTSPIMNMGLVTSTNRHTAFDSSVVFHEFMHGVTNRLVGGRLNSRALDAPQSGGMGEGWSDYIACSINNATVVGDWVVNRTNGIRQFPYDNNFPDHFGNLGTGRYTQVHNIGEIWAATLLEMNRRLGTAFGVQLVVDALKLTPASPSFLDARDALFKALDNLLTAGKLSPTEHQDKTKTLWAVFARFGMGPQARSNGASLSGIVADFDVPGQAPPDLPVTTIKVDTSPNLEIPDNQAAGVSSVLTVAQSGQIKRLNVAVEIPHTYIGDLLVTLVTPTGASVTLHNRSGASADNLIRTYTSDEVSGLAALIGTQARGNWSLQVSDQARIDRGTLRRWGLEMEVASAAQTTRGEATPALTIPDNTPTGIASLIAISPAGQLKDIVVAVDITHTYIGDLIVELINPSGTQAILHQRTGGSQDNLIRTYELATTPDLADMVNQPIQGNWELKVSDRAGRDVGKLNRWSLDLTYTT